MTEQTVKLGLTVSWRRPEGRDRPWRWGDRKDVRVDPSWSRRNVIYRWVKNSTGEVAMIGETERMLTERVDNYLHANQGGGVGATNKKLYEEQSRLDTVDDFLYVEFTDEVPGFELTDQRDRRHAEALLRAVTKPYLQ